MSSEDALRDAMIEAMESVRDNMRPGVVYHLIPAFADAIIELLADWREKGPGE